MSRLFCFGLGFCATALAQRLLPLGWSVAASARTPERADEIRRHACEPVPLDETARALVSTTHLLISAAPGPDGDPFLRLVGSSLAEAAPHLRWVGYLSTTGVYGDHAGGWVTEQTQVAPSSDRARRRVAAEQAWLKWGHDTGTAVQVFRLAGIYGPGRNQLQSLREGTARRIVKAGQVFSRTHVSDVAAVLEASIARPRAGAIYNVCDDEPAPPDEVIAFAAQLLGVPPPPAEDFDAAMATMSEMARSFYAESKRVSNALIKSELGVKLAYPTYREGLSALSQIKSSPFVGR